jgi:hypothetical protein
MWFLQVGFDSRRLTHTSALLFFAGKTGEGRKEALSSIFLPAIMK